MAITQYYVRPVNGNDIAGQGTTHATAYKTLQFAFNDIGGTHGQGADGDQVNLCSEGPNVNAAALSLAGYGAPSISRPLIVRGYTTIAKDGGIGEIDCNGATMWLLNTYNSIKLIDLEVRNPGNNTLIYLNENIYMYHCYPHQGASAPVNQYAVRVRGNPFYMAHCYVPAFGTGATARTVQSSGTDTRIYANYIESVGQMALYTVDTNSHIWNNLIYARGTAWGIYNGGTHAMIWANAVFAQAGNTNAGIRLIGGVRIEQSVFNNIIVGFNGVGGIGVDLQSGDHNIIGNNAFYNNTANYANAADIYFDLRGNDVALAANPFVNAAAGNFMLTAAAQALLRSRGWPGQYFGATSTDTQLTIGPVQYGEGGGGRRAKLQVHGG